MVRTVPWCWLWGTCLPVQEMEDTGLILGLGESLERGVMAYSGILAWRVPWTKEPGGLQSMGSLGVGHNWANLTHINSPHSLRVENYTQIWTTCDIIWVISERSYDKEEVAQQNSQIKWNSCPEKCLCGLTAHGRQHLCFWTNLKFTSIAELSKHHGSFH